MIHEVNAPSLHLFYIFAATLNYEYIPVTK